MQNDPAQSEAWRHVAAAITSRRSVRAFLPDPVPRAALEALLEVAARAPSGTNIQPWRVHVLAGAARDELVARTLAAHDDPAVAATHQPEYDYYPAEWFSPYIDRRRRLGWDLYGLLGIGKGDRAAMHAQEGRNFRFFDAPVGLMLTIDRRLGRGSWMDAAMFMQTLMIAARGLGLDTCPQAAWCKYHRIVREVLALPDEQMLAFGMAIGHADPDAAVNRLAVGREPVASFATFIGFRN